MIPWRRIDSADPELAVGGRVDHQDAVLAAGDRRRASWRGGCRRGRPPRRTASPPAGAPPRVLQHQEAAVGLQVGEELLEDQVRQLRGRDVGEEGEGDVVQDLERRREPLQLGRVGQLAGRRAAQARDGIRRRDHRPVEPVAAGVDDDPGSGRTSSRTSIDVSPRTILSPGRTTAAPRAATRSAGSRSGSRGPSGRAPRASGRGGRGRGRGSDRQEDVVGGGAPEVQRGRSTRKRLTGSPGVWIERTSTIRGV